LQPLVAEFFKCDDKRTDYWTWLKNSSARAGSIFSDGSLVIPIRLGRSKEEEEKRPGVVGE
ncbi:MAG: hypothetical protein ACE5GH_05115, partial [Fidelibacterota bacterium]